MLPPFVAQAILPRKAKGGANANGNDRFGRQAVEDGFCPPAVIPVWSLDRSIARESGKVRTPFETGLQYYLTLQVIRSTGFSGGSQTETPNRREIADLMKNISAKKLGLLILVVALLSFALNVTLGTPSRVALLPSWIQVKQVLYDAGPFETIMYGTLSDATFDDLSESNRRSLLFGGARAKTPTGNNGGLRWSWYKYPMFDGNLKLANLNAREDLAERGIEETFLVRLKHLVGTQVSSRTEFLKIIASSHSMGNGYFGMTSDGECALMLDIRDKLFLLICMDH